MHLSDSTRFSIKTIAAHMDKDSVNNFMCVEKDGVSSGKHFWKVRFETLKSEVGVCLTTKKCIKNDYVTKGLCSHENLGNNSPLRIDIDDIGAQLSAEDTVGFSTFLERDRFKVNVDVKGKSLRLNLKLPDTLFDTTSLLVTFKQIKSAATCTKGTDVMERQGEIISSIEGDWILKNITENEVTSPHDSVGIFGEPTIHFKPDNDENNEKDLYKWSVEAKIDKVNYIWSKFSKNRKQWKTSNTKSNYGIVNKHYPTPDRMFMMKIFNLIKMVEIVKIESDGTLSIKSGNMATAWVRYDGPQVKHLIDPNTDCNYRYTLIRLFLFMSKFFLINFLCILRMHGYFEYYS